MATTFVATGKPRTQAPSQVWADGDKISIKATFRQFEWVADVTLRGDATDAYEVGFIQNMTKNSIRLLYGDSATDPSPRNSSVVVSPIPILDSKVPNAVWANGVFAFLGTAELAPDFPLPPGISRSTTTLTAHLSGGDDPGGRFPVSHPDLTKKQLRQIEADHEFITWLAVRSRSAPAADVKSYQLLHFATWIVERTIRIDHFASGWGFRFTRNKTAIKLVGTGGGSITPIVRGPIANDQAHFVW